MNRRSILGGLAAATALAASTASVAAAEADTPVMTLFREWLARYFVIEATKGITDDEFNELVGNHVELANQMMEVESVDARDFAAKLIAVTFFFEGEYNGWEAAFNAEAHQILGIDPESTRVLRWSEASS